MESGYHVLDIPAFLQNNSGYGTKSTEPSGSHHVGYFTYVYEDVIQYRAVDFATGEWLTAYDQTIKMNTSASEEDETTDPETPPTSEETTEPEAPPTSEETTEPEAPPASEETTEPEAPPTSEETTESETPSTSEVTTELETSDDSEALPATDSSSSTDISVSPGTGDDFRAGLWLIIAAIALCVGTYMVYQKKHIK